MGETLFHIDHIQKYIGVVWYLNLIAFYGLQMCKWFVYSHDYDLQIIHSFSNGSEKEQNFLGYSWNIDVFSQVQKPGYTHVRVILPVSFLMCMD